MRKNIYSFLFIIFLGIILFPSLVSAECTEEEKYNLNKLVDNIQVKYEHTGNNLFKVTLYNIPEYITGTSIIGMFNDVNSDNPTNSVSNFIGGSIYQVFYVTNVKNECGLEVLKTVDLNIPVYNSHSKKDVCKDEKYSDFEYCSEIVNKKISEDDFNEKLEKFKKNQDLKLSNDNTFNLLQILKDNFLFICIPIVLIAISIVSVIVYRKKKSKL